MSCLLDYHFRPEQVQQDVIQDSYFCGSPISPCFGVRRCGKTRPPLLALLTCCPPDRKTMFTRGEKIATLDRWRQSILAELTAVDEVERARLLGEIHEA